MQSLFNFSKTRGRYSYYKKRQVADLIHDLKTAANSENDERGIYSKAIRQVFPDLKKAKYTDAAFQAALSVAKRAYVFYYIKPSDEAPPEKMLKRTFRLPGKSGPKIRAPEIRDGLYEWLVDVRSAVKARIPRTVLKAKAEDLQVKWIAENPDSAVDYVKVGYEFLKQFTL